LLVAPFNLVFIGLAQIPRVGAQLMAIVVYRDSQWAEYLADYLASVAAGKSAAISMLHKLQLQGIYEYVVQRTALNRDARPLFDELAHQIAIMPPRELERIRRVGLMEQSGLDDTHPPTHQRIGFMEKRGALEGRVRLAGEEWQTLKRELAQVHPWAEKMILDLYKANIQ
jgi:Zn-dependent protease with chaperone function